MIIHVDFRRSKPEVHPFDHECCRQHGTLYFCPYLKWYLKEHCGFINRRECMNFKRQCGVLFSGRK